MRGYMLSEITASTQLSQIRYAAKASRVPMLMTGTEMAMPANCPADTSSVTRDETTMPDWVLRKKFKGRVRR